MSVKLTVSATNIKADVEINPTVVKEITETITIPASVSGPLTTRVDSMDGETTVVGHSFVDGEKIDIYFEGGALTGCEVSVTGDDFTWTGGTPADLEGASVLPAEDTTLIFAHQIDAYIPFPQADLTSLLLLSNAACVFRVLHSTTEVFTVLLEENNPYQWTRENYVANPIDDDFDIITVSNGSLQEASFRLYLSVT